MKSSEEIPPRKQEEPCEETGKGCEWVWEEWEDSSGESCFDVYCQDCYRYRDYSLDEYGGEQT